MTANMVREDSNVHETDYPSIRVTDVLVKHSYSDGAISLVFHPTTRARPGTSEFEPSLEGQNSPIGELKALIPVFYPAPAETPRSKPLRANVQNGLTPLFQHHSIPPHQVSPPLPSGVSAFSPPLFLFSAASKTARSFHGIFLPSATWIQSSLPFPVPITTSPSRASEIAFLMASVRSEIFYICCAFAQRLRNAALDLVHDSLAGLRHTGSSVVKIISSQ